MERLSGSPYRYDPLTTASSITTPQDTEITDGRIKAEQIIKVDELFKARVEAFTEIDAPERNIDLELDVKINKILDLEDERSVSGGGSKRDYVEREARKRELLEATKSHMLQFRCSEFYGKFLDQSMWNLQFPIQPYHIIESHINDLNAFKDSALCTDKTKVDRVIRTLKETQQISYSIMQVQAENLKRENEVNTSPPGTKSSKEVERIQWLDEQFGNIAEGIGERLENLKTGEQLVIHGGTKDHSIMFIFQKDVDGTYSLNVINTDDQPRGIAEFMTIKKWGLDLQNFCIKGVSKERMADRKFLKELLECKNKSRQKGDTFLSNPTSRIYDLLKEHLVGEGEGRGKCGYEGPIFSRQNQANTCTTRCLAEFISQSLGPEQNSQFHISSLDRNIQRLDALGEAYDSPKMVEGTAKMIRAEKIIPVLQKIGLDELAERKKEQAEKPGFFQRTFKYMTVLLRASIRIVPILSTKFQNFTAIDKI